jgi:hypothetical protein
MNLSVKNAIRSPSILAQRNELQNNCYFDDSSLISDLASDCGIDWAKLQHYITFDGRKVTRGIELSKAYRGKVFAVGSQFTAKDGRDYKRITFYTNKHGGVSHTYSEWHEAQARKIDELSPVIPFKKKFETAVTPAFDNAPTDKQAADLKLANERWNVASTENVANHPYLITKNLPIDGIEIRRGMGRYGDCLMVQIFNIHQQVIGYQHLYAQNLPNRNDNKDFVGQISEGFAIIGGTFDDCINGAYHVEGLSTGLGVYHSVGTKRGQLKNNKKLPVVVSFSAGNLGKNIDNFIARGCEHQLIAADNDAGKVNGNTGVYVAMVAAKKHNLPVFVPVSDDGAPVDFADTIAFTTLNVSKMPEWDYTKKLYAVAPQGHLTCIGQKLAYEASKFVPAKMSKDDAIRMVETVLNSRQLKKQQLQRINARGIIHNELKRREEWLKTWHTITDKSSLKTVKFEHSDNLNEDIALAIYRQFADDLGNRRGSIWLDNRALAAGKTQLLKIVKQVLKTQAIAYVTHRVSLSKDAATVIGLDHYQDLIAGELTNGIAACVNSIRHHHVDKGRFNILFLDEFRQLLEHVCLGSVEDRQAVERALAIAIELADLVICSDADLNDFCIRYLNKHALGKTIHLIETPHVECTRELTILENFDSARAEALERIESGVVVACTSREVAKQNEQYLNNHRIDNTLLIHSQNSGGERQSKFLANANEVLKEEPIDALVHSPSIGSGVSITTEKFNTNYLFDSGNLPANEKLQMLARNRMTNDWRIAFSPLNQRDRITDEDLLHEGEGRKAAHYTEAVRINGYTAYVPNELGRMRIELMAARNQDLNDAANNVVMLAQIKGLKINYENQIVIDDSNHSKGLSAQVKQKTIDATLAAKHLDDAQAKVIESRPTTQAQSDSLNRYKTTVMTGKSHDVLTADDVERLLYKKTMAQVINFETLTANSAELRQWDKQNALSQNKTQCKLSIQALGNAVIEPLKNLEFIDVHTARQLCVYLNDNAAEIGANGLGNYSKKSKYPVRTLGTFTEKFGYKLLEKCTRGARGQQLCCYELVPIDYVAEYAANRQMKNAGMDID